jgi:hypothetical protein
MAKKIIQDIYPGKKSIRMIKKNDTPDNFHVDIKKMADARDFREDDNLVNKFAILSSDNIRIDSEYFEEKKHVTKNSLIFLWVICILAIATLLFLLSLKFATATLTITPKNQTVALNDTFDISSDKTVAGLHYQVVTITKNLSKNLNTDGEEHVERKATGKVVLYNNFSTSNQRLIINTRLETKDGLIYKTAQSVNIPGIKVINGVKTPGSVEVDIFADDVGDKYNMKLSDLKGDFTVFGFKGTPKYSGFYARLSSDLTGGFVGNVKKVSDDKLTAARTDTNNNLTGDLLKEVYSEKPDQYILFKDNYYTQCSDLPDDSTSGDYKISEDCTINAIMFDKTELSSYIAKDKITDFDGSDVDILWNDNDIVVLTGTTEKPWNETSLKAKFVGPAQIVWSYDANEIINSIIGKDKSAVNSVLDKYKNSVTEIQATIRPMWKNTFPDNASKIKIIDTVRNVIN